MSALAITALIGAIVSEVAGTISLRRASSGEKRWWFGVGIGYLLAFAMLVVVLGQGAALGVVYGIWAAAGVAITAILDRLLFREPLTGVMSLGIILIVGGVLLIELGAQGT